jgi:hypothetical protein
MTTTDCTIAIAVDPCDPLTIHAVTHRLCGHPLLDIQARIVASADSACRYEPTRRRSFVVSLRTASASASSRPRISQIESG